MKNDRQTKNELIKELESVRRKVKKLETMLEKRKHTQQDITERKRVEEALRERERVLVEAQQIAQVGNWDYNIVTDKPTWSKQMFELFGRDPSLGEPSWQEHRSSIHPDDWENLDASVKGAVTIGIPYNIEFRLLHSTKGVRWGWTIGQPVRDIAGKVVQLVGTLQDITERKRVEEALKINETLFRELFDNMESGSAIFTVINDGSKGSDYIIKKINRAGLKMEGKALEEVVGKRFIDIRPAIDSYGLIPVMKKVWETGESAILPIKIYIDERYSNYYENYVFKLPSGEVVTLYDDVTVGKRAEEQIQILSRFPTENPNPVLRIAPEGVILYANDASEPLLTMWNTQIGQVVPDDWRMQIADVFKSGQKKKIEVKCNQQVFSCLLVPMVGTGYLNIYGRDVTESKRGEEEISKSHEELRMLANHLQNIREEERNHLAREFHDQLGQSMTALKMDLSLLLRTISDEKQDVQRKLVAEELQSMQKLVDEASQLLWAIITELRPQMIDDLGLVATFEWEAQQFESRTGISCEFKSTAGDIPLDSKKSIALFRIYQEALTNITRHAHATIVKSGLQRDGEMLVLAIKDNGCGISIDEQFKQKPFGLIGMRERAMALGGQLKISGIAGGGTTIIVRVPL